MQKFHKNKWFAIFVLLPTLVAIVYYGLIAAPQYVSEARFVVKSQNRQSSSLPSLASLIQTTGLGSGQEQTNEIISYIQSRSALQALSKRTDIQKIFSPPQADMFSKYPAPWRDRNFETLYRYYLGAVNAGVDADSGLAVLRVNSFSAKDAQRMNQILLDLSEQLVNNLNQNARSKSIAEAERRVVEAEKRVKSARIALTEFRNSQTLLDPAKQATGVLEISNGLEAQRTTLQAQLEVMVRATPQNPAIPALRGRIASISRQIAAQTGRAVGGDSAISSKLGAYEGYALEQEFASQNLTAANASLEQARSDADRQQFYLERVVEPNEPDAPQLPRRLRQILTVLGSALAFYFIGWMLVVGVLEHAPDNA